MDKQTSPAQSERKSTILHDYGMDILDKYMYNPQYQIDTDWMKGSIDEKMGPINVNTKSDYHLLVTSVKNLVDIVGNRETQLLDSLTEEEYQGLGMILDNLIDIVREDESHILATMMDFVGILIENYEDKHIPELAEI
ncbi:hypothetical protein C6497_05410 [Candidatus Poribacteria bacterium]|nr:MAG: hypothetical protein C6497_05410 [Candidatus Poribacteria bacterium]